MAYKIQQQHHDVENENKALSVLAAALPHVEFVILEGEQRSKFSPFDAFARNTLTGQKWVVEVKSRANRDTSYAMHEGCWFPAKKVAPILAEAKRLGMRAMVVYFMSDGGILVGEITEAMLSFPSHDPRPRKNRSDGPNDIRNFDPVIDLLVGTHLRVVVAGGQAIRPERHAA